MAAKKQQSAKQPSAPKPKKKAWRDYEKENPMEEALHQHSDSEEDEEEEELEGKRPLKKEYVKKGSAAEKAYIEKLMAEKAKVRFQCADFAKDGIKRREKFSKVTDGVNMLYNRQLLMACSRPLMQGLSPESIISTIGMYAGICLLSPNFRKSVSTTVQTMLYPYVSDLADRAKPGSRWARMRDQIYQNQHGRMPLTLESAALTQIGLMESCYDQMREPNVHPRKAADAYEDARAELEAQCIEDGIDPKDLMKAVNTMIGQMARYDTTFADKFNFLAMNYGGPRAVQAPPHEEEQDGVTKTVWTGEYIDRHDGKLMDEMMKPRMPRRASHYEKWGMQFLADIAEKYDNPQAVLRELKLKQNVQYLDRVRNMIKSDNLTFKETFLQGMKDELENYKREWAKAKNEEYKSPEELSEEEEDARVAEEVAADEEFRRSGINTAEYMNLPAEFYQKHAEPFGNMDEMSQEDIAAYGNDPTDDEYIGDQDITDARLNIVARRTWGPPETWESIVFEDEQNENGKPVVDRDLEQLKKDNDAAMAQYEQELLDAEEYDEPEF